MLGDVGTARDGGAGLDIGEAVDEADVSELASGAKSNLVRISRNRGKFPKLACYRRA